MVGLISPQKKLKNIKLMVVKNNSYIVIINNNTKIIK